MGRPRKHALHLPPRVQFRHGAYYYVVQGKWTRLSRDAAEMRREWAKRESEPLATAAAASVPGLIQRYMLEVAPTKSPKYQTECERAAKLLAAAFRAHAPRDVRPSHVAQYLDERARQGRPVAGNREKALLSAIFAQAMRWGIVDSNPCQGVARNTERPRDRLVSPEERAAFVAFARSRNPAVAAVAQLAYLTGQRKQDVLGIKLSQLTPEGIAFAPEKVRSRRPVKVLVEWTPALEEAVAEARALERPARSIYLIASRAGGAYTPSGFDSLWQRVMERWLEARAAEAAAAGEPFDAEAARFHFHDLRAAAVTRVKEQGGVAADLAGITEQTAARVYDRRRVRRAKAAE